MANQNYELQIEITSNIESAISGFDSIKKSVKGVGPAISSFAGQLDRLANGLDGLEKKFKKFGRELTQNVTLPIAALATLSLKNIFDTALAGNGTAAMNSFAASVQQLKRDFDGLLKDIGVQIAPFFEKLAVAAGKLINSYKSLSPETKKLILIFAGIAAAVGPVSLAIASFLGVMSKLLPVFSAALKIFSGFFSLLTAKITIIASLVLSISGLINIFIKLKKSGEDTFSALTSVLKLAAAGFGHYVGGTIIKALAGLITVAGKVVSFFNKDWGESLKQASGFVKSFADDIESEFDNSKSEIDSKLEKIGTDTATAFTFGFNKKLEGLFGDFENLFKRDGSSNLITEKDLENLKQIQQISHQIKLNFTGGLADAFVDIADGSKNAEQAFGDFARSFLRQITQMIIQAQLFRILSGFSGFNSATGGLASAGYIPQPFANGGLIMGPGSGTSDSVPIRASRGEFVMTAAAVKKFGSGFFDRINSISSSKRASSKINHFANGGLVESSQQAPQVVIENSGSDKEISRTEFDPTTAVTTIFLEDLNKNGPISKSIQSSYGVKRGGFR